MQGIEETYEQAEPYADDINVGLRVAKAAQAHGLIARPLGNILILSPTLIMDEDQIARIEVILRDSIIAVMADLPR